MRLDEVFKHLHQGDWLYLRNKQTGERTFLNNHTKQAFGHTNFRQYDWMLDELGNSTELRVLKADDIINMYDGHDWALKPIPLVYGELRFGEKFKFKDCPGVFTKINPQDWHILPSCSTTKRPLIRNERYDVIYLTEDFSIEIMPDAKTSMEVERM